MFDLTKEQIRKAKDQYKWQKWYSSTRKDKLGNPIGWELTFESWITVWIESGHYFERGNYKGQYVMARFNDIGPYSLDNIKIITADENKSEGNKGKIISQEHRDQLKAARAKQVITDEHRETYRQAQLKRWAKYRQTF
jgi:hypothetical protein